MGLSSEGVRLALGRGGGAYLKGLTCRSPGVSLIEEIGGYRILNRRVPLRFLWLVLFSTLTAKAGTVFTVYGCQYPGPGF